MFKGTELGNEHNRWMRTQNTRKIHLEIPHLDLQAQSPRLLNSAEGIHKGCHSQAPALARRPWIPRIFEGGNDQTAECDGYGQAKACQNSLTKMSWSVLQKVSIHHIVTFGKFGTREDRSRAVPEDFASPPLAFNKCSPRFSLKVFAPAGFACSIFRWNN